MNITDYPGLQRRPDTQEIDIKGSLHVFAQGVIALKQEEARLRNIRRYKAAVLKTFDEGHGFRIKGYYDGQLFFHLNPLVVSVVNKLRHKKEELPRLYDEVERHILLNNKRYLRVHQLKSFGDSIIHVTLLK